MTSRSIHDVDPMPFTLLAERLNPDRNGHSMAPHVVTLGTAGGPCWWDVHDPILDGRGRPRAGIATAVIVKDRTYLIDAGHGVGQQMMLAGLSLPSVHGIFITHLHSDHTIGLASLLTFGMYAFRGKSTDPLPVLGPGNRGMLPPVSSHAAIAPEPIFPENPVPGTEQLFEYLMRAYATDLNDRILDGLRPHPLTRFKPQDIQLPERIGYHPNDNPAPTMMPFEIYKDEAVTVTATLVQHPPIAPAFAFRFDTQDGSVTISGDTAPCENLVRLAQDTDLLLHEAIDDNWLKRSYSANLSDIDMAAIDHHRRSHTTGSEAAEIANRAGAKQLALHHLVPGTTPRQDWIESAAEFRGALHVPDDLAEIPFARSQNSSLQRRRNDNENV